MPTSDVTFYKYEFEKSKEVVKGFTISKAHESYLIYYM